ncbi:protein FAM219A isoform X6 [Neophocaena asiaeorientalis asiaeorientalis]|uniref:Protein FAM219A isoform X6 n=1 Tax=Neophocaena asiaeorientalis asiaeorientalis TaxID=1706337 RepID=A0A341C483_NEOAA|nr:protein FAM219A isoform X6 [Neophocaena asiaeorientalis asiaeorientalis]
MWGVDRQGALGWVYNEVPQINQLRLADSKTPATKSLAPPGTLSPARPRGKLQFSTGAQNSRGISEAKKAPEKQRELARKGSLKNGSMGSPVNQQPKKNNVMARTRLVVPNKGYSSLDQSPDEKPLVALDTDSDDDFDMSRYSSSGYSSAEVRPHPFPS